MRFCPFCSAENAIEATHCKTCARRLPPLPARSRKPARSVGVEPREPDEQAIDEQAIDGRAIGEQAIDGRAPGESPAQAAAGLAVEAQAMSDSPAQAADSAPGQVPRSLLHRMAPSPAALRRPAPGAELRPEGVPARRTTDHRAGSGASLAADSAASLAADSAASLTAHAGSGATLAADAGALVAAEPGPVAGAPAQAEPGRDAEPHRGEWSASARPQSAHPAGDASAGEIAMQTAGEIAMQTAGDAAMPVGIATEHGAAGYPGEREYAQAAAHPPHAGYSQVASAPVQGAAPPSGQLAHPDMLPIPGVPEAGALNAVRYALAVTRARWQRRDAIRSLHGGNQQDTAELDEVLGALGKQARGMGPALGLDQPVLAAENAALDQAEERRARIEQECVALGEKQAQEHSGFQEVEAEHQAAMSELEAQMHSAQSELGYVQAQQRGLRDKHKTLERQYRAYLKAAEDRDQQAAQAAMGESRAGLRQGAEDMRREAKALEPELHDVDSRLAALELPISQALARVEALQSQLDSQRRSHDDAREGHRHRLAEIDAELSKKSFERSQAEGEIQRRLHALGTLVDLHRPQGEPDSAELAHLYGHIDGLRGAIAARSAEIDRLTAEREAYDRASRTRGFLILGGGIAAVVLLIIILIALV